MSKTKLFYRCVYLSDSSRRGAIIMDAYKELEEARQKLIDELNETSNDPSFIELQKRFKKMCVNLMITSVENLQYDMKCVYERDPQRLTNEISDF